MKVKFYRPDSSRGERWWMQSDEAFRWLETIDWWPGNGWKRDIHEQFQQISAILRWMAGEEG